MGPRGFTGFSGGSGSDGPPGPPGPAGPGSAIVETGSYSAPVTISGAITVPTDVRSRLYIKGNAAVTTVTSIGNGSDTHELYLFGTDDAAKVKLTNLSNVALSGAWEAGQNSQLCLHWIAGASKWVEAGRNEI